MGLIKKRGISPVVATVLLISLALVLAMIIFWWARSTIKEQELKFGAPVGEACKDIKFNADISGENIRINNLGNVPIYGVEIRRKISGAVERIGSATFGTLQSGAGTVKKIEFAPGKEVASDMIAVPIILGETARYTKPFICPEEFGEPV